MKLTKKQVYDFLSAMLDATLSSNDKRFDVFDSQDKLGETDDGWVMTFTTFLDRPDGTPSAIRTVKVHIIVEQKIDRYDEEEDLIEGNFERIT